MKKIRLFPLLLLGILLSVNLTSCSNDDNNDNNNDNTSPENKAELVGTWIWEYEYKDEYTHDYGYASFTFYADGSGFEAEKTADDRWPIKYTVEDNRLTIIDVEDDDERIYEIKLLNSKKMILIDEEGDEWIYTKSDNDNTPSENKAKLVGTWTRYEYRDEYNYAYYSFIFYADGSGFDAEYTAEGDNRWPIKYTVEGNKLTIIYVEDYYEDIYEIKLLNSTTLILIDEDGDEVIYTKSDNDNTSSENKAKLVGTWTYTDQYEYVSLIFYADGSGFEAEGTADRWPIKYTVEGNKLTIIDVEEDYEDIYEIKLLNSTTLILIDEDGDEWTFIKQ